MSFTKIDGTRKGAPHTKGGGNVEMGGPNSNQVVEYVRSYDPRSWTCLHVDEGPLNCTNVTIQNNDVGPCGSDSYQQWADGISVSCRNSVVRNNLVQNPTDGGIVLFGSPGTQVYNNTIWIVNQTLLGGINLVDYEPFQGDFTGTVVRDNLILGGFATNAEQPGEVKGTNQGNAIIKIGIAVGPRVWFGKHFGTNVSRSGTVINNRFSGAFSFAMAVTSAQNFTIRGNSLIGNTSFIGDRGPNCSHSHVVPNPSAFVLDTNLTQELNLQSNFQKIPDGDSLTCIVPPPGGDFWPFLGDLEGSRNRGLSRTTAVAIAFGLIGGVIVIAIISWYIRRWAQRRAVQRQKAESVNNT
ncbi:hypothetical protein APHAL10511_001622 [Amanita phalloides]|nr:hypothetical protein APHAL10511_001622 [Amanita phalloides]